MRARKRERRCGRGKKNVDAGAEKRTKMRARKRERRCGRGKENVDAGADVVLNVRLMQHDAV